MGRILIRIAIALLLVAGVGAIAVYQKVMSLESEHVSGDVYVIFGGDGPGLGGNTAVLRTERGSVIVDTKSFRMQGARIAEMAQQLAGGPPQAIINTHYHLDHTHGNPAFAAGARVVATDGTLAYLRAFDSGYWSGAAARTLPSETFPSEYEISVGGKTIRCHHFGPGHTGGDLVVLFVEDRVLAAGDLFFNGRYPSVDHAAGGSLRQWDGVLERVLALDFDRVIPGHGPLGDREGLRAFQGFLREAWAAGESAARAGQSLDELLATAELRGDAGYAVDSIPFVFRLDRASVLQRAWEEATGAVRPRPAPGAPGR